MIKRYIINMTTVYKHISHSAQCNNIRHVLAYKQDRIFNVFKTHTYSNIDYAENISSCRTPNEVVNFINLHNMFLKYDIPFNRYLLILCSHGIFCLIVSLP